MQVLTTKCPYCQQEVDSTIEHLDGPVICPKCEKPFEMEIPTAIVTSVAEEDQDVADDNRIAEGPRKGFVLAQEGLQIVEPTDVYVMAPTDTPQLTLISCYPFRINTQRIAVFGRLVDPSS